MKKQKYSATSSAGPVTAQAQSPAAEKNNRLSLLNIALLFFVFIIAYISVFDEKINLNGDNIYYHILGGSLANGQGYTNIFSPTMEAHNHFPPGYPFIISLFMRMGLDSITFFNYLNGILAFASIIIFCLLLLRVGFEKKIVLLIGIMFALNGSILNYAIINMSEVPFLFFSLVTLYSYVRLSDPKPYYKNIFFWLMIISVIIACYIRTTGITLVFTLTVLLLLRKKWLPAILFIGLFVASQAPWSIRSAKLGGNSYMQQFQMKDPYDPAKGKATVLDYGARMLENADRYLATEIPGALFFGRSATGKEPWPLYLYVLGTVTLGILVWGMIRYSKKDWSLMLFLVTTGGLLLLWPSSWRGVRYMIPIVPLLILYFILGLNDLLSRLAQGKMKWNSNLLYILIPISFYSISVLRSEAQKPYPPNFKNYFDMAEWAGNNLPKNSIICCRKPELFYLFSNMRCVNYAYTEDDKAFIKDLEDKKIDYIVVDQLGFSSTGKFEVPAINKNHDRFRMLRVLPQPETYLLQFIKK